MLDEHLVVFYHSGFWFYIKIKIVQQSFLSKFYWITEIYWNFLTSFNEHLKFFIKKLLFNEKYLKLYNEKNIFIKVTFKKSNLEYFCTYNRLINQLISALVCY